MASLCGVRGYHGGGPEGQLGTYKVAFSLLYMASSIAKITEERRRAKLSLPWDAWVFLKETCPAPISIMSDNWCHTDANGETK